MIWKRGYTTLVTREGYCASACTFIWLSGRKSAIQVGSPLCFHEAFDKNTFQTNEEANVLIVAYLKTVGLTDKQAWTLTHAAPPAEHRCATTWWARELGFTWQEYPYPLGTATCPARFCVGKP